MDIFNKEESVEVIKALKESLQCVDTGKDAIKELASTQCGKYKRNTIS